MKKSAAESAFARQFGFQTTSRERAPSSIDSKDSKIVEQDEKAASIKPNSRKQRCPCDCPHCGVSAKQTDGEEMDGKEKADDDEDEEEKSTIGGGQLDNLFTEPAESSSDSPDLAFKLKLVRQSSAVRCPQCHANLHLLHGGSDKQDDEESIDENDSLYEIKDAYSTWSNRKPAD